LKAGTAGDMFYFCFLLICLLTIPAKPVIPKSTGPSSANFSGLADDQSEVSFSISGKLPWQPIFWQQILLILSTEMIFVTSMASGAAGRATLGFALRLVDSRLSDPIIA